MRIVAGTLKNKPIIAPKGHETRPTSERLRESLFNICQSYIEDADFLDLCAGSGAMGLEALSRGAKSATFIDNNRESILAIKDNIRSLGVEDRAHVFQGDVFDYLEKLAKRGKTFNIIYADPPYEMDSMLNGQPISCSNHILHLIENSSLLAPNGTLFMEDSLRGKPDTDYLRTLKLESSRRLGRSILLQFERL